jgi:hypothetical protein
MSAEAAGFTTWGLAWAAAGWIAAQVTSVLRDYVYRWWMKRAIDKEVRQLHEEIERLWGSYARSLQIQTIGGVDGAAPLPLSNFIFVNYYKDAVLVATSTHRIALQMIHAYVSSLNRDGERLSHLGAEIEVKAVREGRLDDADLDLYGRHLKQLLVTVGITRWHMHHYLTHPWFPVLDLKDTEIHADYLQHIRDVEADVERIVKSAKGLTRADFSLSAELKPNKP